MATKKTTTQKTPAKKAAAKKATGDKTPVKKATAKKATAKKAVAKKAPTKKAVAKKAPVKKAEPRKRATKAIVNTTSTSGSSSFTYTVDFTPYETTASVPSTTNTVIKMNDVKSPALRNRIIAWFKRS